MGSSILLSISNDNNNKKGHKRFLKELLLNVAQVGPTAHKICRFGKTNYITFEGFRVDSLHFIELFFLTS
jgi:hypothetical protein